MGAYIGVKHREPGDNTLAYYPLKSNTLDYSGNQRNLSGSGSFVDGGPGKVYQVTNAYADNSAFNINGTNPFTLCVWVKITQFPSSYDTIMGFWLASNTGTHDKEIDIHPGGVIIAQMRNGDPGYEITSSQNVELNKRYNIVFSFTGSGRYLYINGQLVGSGNGGSSRNLNQQRLGFRRLQDGGMQVSYAVAENIGWSADNVRTYFNQTKHLYGLQ